MKIAVVTDSNSGISREEGETAGSLCASYAVFD